MEDIKKILNILYFDKCTVGSKLVWIFKTDPTNCTKTNNKKTHIHMIQYISS